jgi:hypothetical protein
MKTLDDYLKEPDLADEPEALQKIHAIRLKIHDVTKGMTAAEHTAYSHKGNSASIPRTHLEMNSESRKPQWDHIHYR